MNIEDFKMKPGYSERLLEVVKKYIVYIDDNTPVSFRFDPPHVGIDLTVTYKYKGEYRHRVFLTSSQAARDIVECTGVLTISNEELGDYVVYTNPETGVTSHVTELYACQAYVDVHVDMIFRLKG